MVISFNILLFTIINLILIYLKLLIIINLNEWMNIKLEDILDWSYKNGMIYFWGIEFTRVIKWWPKFIRLGVQILNIKALNFTN